MMKSLYNMKEPYILPFLGNTPLLCAVLGAIKWKNSPDYLDRACERCAKRYNVDVEEVKQIVWQAQSPIWAGYPRRLLFFACIYRNIITNSWGERKNTPSLNCEILRGYDIFSLIKKLHKNDDWSKGGSQCYIDRIRPFLTKEEAIACLEEWQREAQAV